MTRAIQTAVVVAAGAFVLGCGNYTTPQVAPATQTPAQRNFDALWQGSLEVLRRYHFEIDRRDPRAGVITTRRMLARHWFEFWRPDAVTAEDLAEGTLQTVNLQATVRIAPVAGKDGQFAAGVEVAVFRPRRLGREIIAAGEAYGDFLDAADEDEYSRTRRELTRAARRRRGKVRGADPDDLAVEEGRQANLARKLTAEIRAAADKRLAQSG